MNFQKSWDIYFWKFLDHDDFWKFMEPEFQNFNEICFFSVFYIIVIKSVKKHLFFLFKVYYSLMVDNCTERRNIKRNFDNIFFLGGGCFLNFIEVCHNEWILFFFLLRGHHKFFFVVLICGLRETFRVGRLHRENKEWEKKVKCL